MRAYSMGGIFEGDYSNRLFFKGQANSRYLMAALKDSPRGIVNIL